MIQSKCLRKKHKAKREVRTDVQFVFGDDHPKYVFGNA